MSPFRMAGPNPGRRALAVVLAAALFVPAVQARPQETEAALESVRAALAAGDAPGAVAAALSALERDPSSPLVLTWLGHAHRFAGDLGEAALAYRRAIRLDPEAAEALMGLGEIQRAVGDLPGAAESFERATSVAPDNPAPYRAAGTVRMQMTQHESAARLFARYLALRPHDLDVIYLAGVASWLAGDHETAIHALERGLEQAPDSVPLQYALGVVLADRPDQHERALRLLAAAEQGHWEEAEAAYLTGRILASRAEHEAAAAALRRSLAIDPDKLDAWYRLSQSLARMGQRDEARAAMQRFSELQRAFNDEEHRLKQIKALRNELSRALAEDRLEEADTLLDELMAESPDDPETLVQAAKLWMSLGRVEDALDAATAASQLAPADWEARYVEGVLLLASGNAPGALAALEASRRAQPMFADTHNMIGNTLMVLERPLPAIDAYLAATELETDNPGYWDNLAAACRAAGRFDLEAQARETADRLRPQQPSER